jgi:polyphenol oxidase
VDFHKTGILTDNISLHSSKSLSFITYSALDKFSSITVLTTLRSSIIDNINSSHVSVILPMIIPLIKTAFRVPISSFIAGRQVHSANVADVSSITIGSSNMDQPVILSDTDGLITAQKGMALVVLTADCLPVFLYDDSKHIAGLVHAGRKGTELEISAAAVKEMVKLHNCNPSDIVALIGASIGPCCYQVDLWEENRRQLEKQGIREIHSQGICTGCHTELFYSYHVEKGTTGRMVSIILME